MYSKFIMTTPKVVLTHGFCYVLGVVPNTYTSVKITFDGTYTVEVSWTPPYPTQQSVFYIRDIQHIPKVVLTAIRNMKDPPSADQLIGRVNELLADFQKDADEMEDILKAKIQPKLERANRVAAELLESRKQDHECIAALEEEVEALKKREQELTIWCELSSIHLDEMELTNKELQLQIKNTERIQEDTILNDALTELSI